MPSTFPTTLSDLKFQADDPCSKNFYHSLKALRKATLSISNRLKSIELDSRFAICLASSLSLPLISNERCGSWYIPPEFKAGSAYFKSTDGHFGQWNFSLRRLNLPVLEVVGKQSGAIIVDSTRRGKVFPDSLTKTVPIWAAVINRVVFPEKNWSHELQTPSGEWKLACSEAEQITQRLTKFVDAFKGLDLDTEPLRQSLSRPMRLFWTTGHYTGALDTTGCPLVKTVSGLDWYPLVLCSVSKRVVGTEISEGGYVQGAGDDSEGWAHGLTPQLFWQHKDLLREATDGHLPALIEQLACAGGPSQPEPARVSIQQTRDLWIGLESDISPENERVSNDTWQPIDSSITVNHLFINCNRAPIEPPRPRTLDLGCRAGKLGSRDLRMKLGAIEDFLLIEMEKGLPVILKIACETGRDLSVGAGLMVLCLFYDETGSPRSNPFKGTAEREALDKSFIRQRLAWIIASHPSANPSRATLQAVHAFLMGPPH